MRLTKRGRIMWLSVRYLFHNFVFLLQANYICLLCKSYFLEVVYYTISINLIKVFLLKYTTQNRFPICTTIVVFCQSGVYKYLYLLLCATLNVTNNLCLIFLVINLSNNLQITVKRYSSICFYYTFCFSLTNLWRILLYI